MLQKERRTKRYRILILANIYAKLEWGLWGMSAVKAYWQIESPIAYPTRHPVALNVLPTEPIEMVREAIGGLSVAIRGKEAL